MREFIKLLFNTRFRKVFFLFVSFVAQFWWLGKTKRYLNAEKVAEKYRHLYAKQAETFTDVALDLGGLLIKLGQFFSSRVDILPKEYTDELAKLQDAVTPLPTDIIVERIELEYGKKIADVFQSFSQEPLAAASLGQVHKAQLHSGETVVAKVLRPGIEEIVAIDLETLKVILSLSKRFTTISNSVDLDQVYREFKETVNDELSYIKEGQNAEVFKENFSESPIYLPKIHWPYCTDKVLVMEYISGVKINDFSYLDEKGIDRKKLAETLFASYLRQILVDGFFHADPHPGNLLVKADGTLVFIDFGMVGTINASMKDNMVKLVLALFKKDAGGVVNAFKDLGFIKEGIDYNPIIKSVDLMIRRFYDEKDVSNLDLEELSHELRELMYSQPFQLPAQTTFLGKSVFTLAGICYGLDEDFDLVKVSSPYVGMLFPENMAGDSEGLGKFDFILDQAKTIGLEAIALPEKLNRLINGIESGEIRLHPAKTFEKNLIEHQTFLANRIVNAVITTGLGIVGAILYTGNSTQLGIVLLGLSGFIGLGLLRGKESGSSSRRNRRRRQGAGPGVRRPRFHP